LTRLGWALLLFFLLIGAGFVWMLSTGEEIGEPAAQPRAERPATEAGALVIPVDGVKAEQLSDTWGQSRAGGARIHKAIDIMAPRGTLVVAAAPGRVEKLFDSKDGGMTVYVRSPDGRTIHYYAHLDTYRAGLREGQQVRTGEVLGTVGSTGNASPDGPHLHFEVKRMAPGESWHQGEEVNPYPLLAGTAARR
jgi:peptidoglycan LD-endopeptidase LytH